MNGGGGATVVRYIEKEMLISSTNRLIPGVTLLGGVKRIVLVVCKWLSYHLLVEISSFWTGFVCDCFGLVSSAVVLPRVV